MRPPLPRSHLYVPGNAPEKFPKAMDSGADAVMFDLEDAVPIAEKGRARNLVAEFLSQNLHSAAGEAASQDPRQRRPQLWVRVNPGSLGEDDIGALAGATPLMGIALAKADSAEDVARASERLDKAGDTTTVLMPLIESARSIMSVGQIAHAHRVHQLQMGEVDLTADIGVTPGEDEIELLTLRTAVVVASRAAEINPPVGPVSRITRDPEALEASTRRLARLGFRGRMCIHPGQIEVVHRVFTPTENDIAHAQQILHLLTTSESGGSGVCLDQEGRLIDPAVVRSARTTLDLAAWSH